MWGNKFKNVKVKYLGYSFGSKLEASVYSDLLNRAKTGEIEVLQLQPSVYLTEAKILYKPDFKALYKATGEIVYIEAKGIETAVWRIKKRLWKHYGPAPLEIYMGSHERPRLVETLIPVTR